MFDFSNILQSVSGAIGGSGIAEHLSAGGAINALAEQGFDLQALQDLPVDDVFAALSSAGIDPGQFTDGQIGELLGLINGEGPGS